MAKLSGALRDGRTVSNLFGGSINQANSLWSWFNPTNAITFSPDNLSVTFTYTAGVTTRAFISRATTVIAGRSYAFRFAVSNKTGSFQRENVDIIGSLASSVEINNIENGERAVIVTANANGTITCRLGFGIDNNDNINVDGGFTMSNIQAELLAVGQAVPSEYSSKFTANTRKMGFARDILSLLQAPLSGGLLIESYGDIYSFVNNFGVSFLTDSFGDENDEFAAIYDRDNADKFTTIISIPGAGLLSLTTADIEAVITQNEIFDANAVQSGALVIQRIVNDIVGGTSATASLAFMQTLTDFAKTLGLGVVVCTCPPFGNNANYTAAKQTQAELYNSGLVTQYANDDCVEVYDAFATLRDGATFNLLAAYDSGDGLHPNGVGAQALSDEMSPVIDLLPSTVVSTVDATCSDQP